MIVIIKKGKNVNVYHAGFDDAKVLNKDGCHHQKGENVNEYHAGFDDAKKVTT